MYHVSMIGNDYIEFEWDERKAAINVKKHGVSFESAADAFSDPYARVVWDVMVEPPCLSQWQTVSTRDSKSIPIRKNLSS